MATAVRDGKSTSCWGLWRCCGGVVGQSGSWYRQGVDVGGLLLPVWGGAAAGQQSWGSCPGPLPSVADLGLASAEHDAASPHPARDHHQQAIKVLVDMSTPGGREGDNATIIPSVFCTDTLSTTKLSQAR